MTPGEIIAAVTVIGTAAVNLGVTLERFKSMGKRVDEQGTKIDALTNFVTNGGTDGKPGLGAKFMSKHDCEMFRKLASKEGHYEDPT